jgi:hypothetical protein
MNYKLSMQEKANQQTINMMEEKLMSMQAHVEDCNKKLEHAQNQV